MRKNTQELTSHALSVMFVKSKINDIKSIKGLTMNAFTMIQVVVVGIILTRIMIRRGIVLKVMPMKGL